MTWREVTNAQTRLVFRLSLAGLPVRYWSRGDAAAVAAANPTAVPQTGGAVEYVEREGIIGVGDQTISISMNDAIAQDGAVRVRLASRGDLADQYDPRVVFGRLGSRGSRKRAVLTTTIPHASLVAAGQIDVDRDVSSWPVPGFVHIEQETFYVIGTGGTGGAGDPFHFDVGFRKSALSRVDAHLVDASQGWHPEVTSDIVSWLGRHAILEVAECYEDGSTSSWAEVVRGIVAKSPEIGEHGTSVELDLAPWTTLLAGPIGASVANGPRAETGFTQGFHYSDGVNGITLEMVQFFEPNCAWVATAGPIANGDDWLTVSAGSGSDTMFANCFATTPPGAGGLPIGHPRRGRFLILHNDYPDIYYGTDTPAANQIPCAPSFTINNATSPSVMSADISETYRVDIFPAGVEGLYQWPADALAAINSPTGWVPRTKDGDDGQFADVAILANGAGDIQGPAIQVRFNGPYFQWLGIKFNSFGQNGDVWHGPFAFDSFLGQTKHWFGIDLAQPGSDAHYDPRPEDPTGANGPTHEQAHAGQWTHTVKVVCSPRDTTTAHTFGFRSLKTAYHQTGEKHLGPLQYDIIDLGAAHQKIHVTYYQGGEEKTGVFSVMSKFEVFDSSGGSQGWVYQIQESTLGTEPSCGDTPGEQPCVFRPHLEFREEDPKRIILNLLYSGQGTGANHASWDVLPFGWNLTDDDVDWESFFDFTVPQELRRWSLAVRPGDDGSKVLGGLLHALGAALVPRFDPQTGRRRIALVPTGVPNPLDASVTVSNAALLAEPDRASTDDKVITRYELTVNHSPQTREGTKVTWNDRHAAGKYRTSSTMSLDLLGLQIAQLADAPQQAYQYLSSVFGRLSAQFGDPRRVYDLPLSLGDVLAVDPGAVVLVSADGGVGTDGTLGLNGTTARAQSVTYGWDSLRSSVKAVAYPGNGSGWNMSMMVDSVPGGAGVVVVKANQFSRTRHPITGAVQTDASFFSQGDEVLYVPAGDYASRTTTTITSIVGNTITLNPAPPSLNVGDTIRPAAYDDVTAAVRRYAYGADEDATLGSSNDDAQTVD